MYDLDNNTFIDRLLLLASILDLDEDDCRNDYSGRCMYGRRCVGITHHSFSKACHAAGQVGLPVPSTDSMGMDFIMYWEDYDLSDEEFDDFIDRLGRYDDSRYEVMPILNKDNDGNADLTGWQGLIDNRCGGIVAYFNNTEIAEDIMCYFNRQD